MFGSGQRRVVTVNCVPVIRSDVASSDGIVHLVESIVPGAQRSLAALLNDDSSFAVFRSLLPSHVADRLGSLDENLTLLLFDDQTFAALPEALKTTLLARRGCTSDFLLHFILRSSVCPAAVELGGSVGVQTLGGVEMNVSRSETGALMFGGMPVIGGPDVATNGLLYRLSSLQIQAHMLAILDLASQTGGNFFAEYLDSMDMRKEIDALHNATLFLPSHKFFEV